LSRNVSRPTSNSQNEPTVTPQPRNPFKMQDLSLPKPQKSRLFLPLL
jgi:hypothetical protein